MNYIKNSHPDNAELSLMLPFNAGMKIYDIDNWDFSEVMDQKDGTFKITTKCKLSGFENWVYGWDGVEADINEYGGGTLNGWREHVISGFSNVLEQKKKQKFDDIAKGLKFSLNAFNQGH